MAILNCKYIIRDGSLYHERIKIKDELQTVAAPVTNRNQGWQAHPFVMPTWQTALTNISYRPSPYVIYGFRFLQPRRRQVWAFGSDPELPAPFACRGNGYPQISPIFQIIAFLWYALTRYWATFTSEFCYTRISPLHYQQLASEFPLSSLQHPCCRFHGFF